MKNREVVEIFNGIADLLEIMGENPFRIRAYRKAAQNIEALSRDVAEVSEKEGELEQIPGIGKDLAQKIREIISTGRLQYYEDIKKEVPSELVDMLSVPGLGPKTAKLFYERLNIKSIEELEEMASSHRLAGLPGIKEKTEENILRGIQMLKRGKERQPLGRVLPVALDILDRLKMCKEVERISLAGSLRRMKDTIRDIDILATSNHPERVMKVFVNLPQIREVLAHGQTKSSIVTHEGLQVDLRVVEKDSYGAALAYFTGSKTHNIRVREMAMKRGLKINEYGIFREDTGKKIGGKEEEDIFRVIGLPYIPPELREDTGEIEAAQNRRLPDLLELSDIKGDLHVHSKWSDGAHTFEELVAGAIKRGYQYLAITDHSKSLGIARGMTDEDIIKQKGEIYEINKRLRGFRLLAGIEVNIRGDGSLDYTDDILARLDIVVAAIHSGFKQSKEQLTSRIIKAIRNPHVDVIAHPTGRLLGERDAYEVDMGEILREAKKHNTTLEINAYPLRLDLNDTYCKRAKELGVPLIISTDAHIINQLDYMNSGVSVARRGWLEKGDILNTLPAERLMAWLKK
ncbi:MAG: DNA polymerase/3'-5' exonuclease PolX [Nitrospirota bacterium]